MKLNDFYYELPREMIAQRPAEPRDSSKLMVLFGDKIEHKRFSDLPHLLKKGDLLVLNNSKVIKARLHGVKETGGKVELLVLKYQGYEANCLIGGKVHLGTKLTFKNSSAVLKNHISEGEWEVEFDEEVDKIMAQDGVMPTPPYIKEELKEDAEYQTIYAQHDGSIAAPTAGLHFTERIFQELEKKGVKKTFVTLHVGLGTFAPVKADNIKEHKMHSEHFEISQDTADLINSTKAAGNRVFIVGTTTMRTLESACENGKIVPKNGLTDIFIYPGYEFKFKSDGLITNFHLPKSTLLMLVAAYVGRERILEAYEEAKVQGYRFYSFGDGMVCLR